MVITNKFIAYILDTTMIVLLFISCGNQTRNQVLKHYHEIGDTLGYKAALFFVENYNEEPKLSPEFIQQHINNRIAAWKKNRYMKNLSWGEFCQYILVYRYFDNDYPENYNEIFKDEIDYFNTLDTSLSVFQAIDSLRYRYRAIEYSAKTQHYSNTVEFIEKAKANCGTMTQFNEILFSTLGFAVTTDFTNKWANTAGDHAWNTLLYNGKAYSFDSFYEPNGWFYSELYNNKTIDTLFNKKRAPKIYRKTFTSIESDLHKNEKARQIPYFFETKNVADVSNSYFETTNITINVPDKIGRNGDFVWIATFNNVSFTPAYWARIIDGKATFNSMGRDILYFFGTYKDDDIHTFGTPIYCDNKGKLSVIQPSQTKTETITLVRKYPCLNINPLIYNSAIFYTQLFGVTPNGTEFILNVGQSISSLTDTLRIEDSVAAYKQYTVYVPYNQLESDEKRIRDVDFRTIADIDFFTQDTNGNIVRVIPNYAKEYASIFDNNTLTFFTVPQKQPIYIDVSFEESIKLYGLNITPKNDKNYIYNGLDYELMMWEENGWHSITKQKATGNSLTFRDVPQEALLLLKCTTEGKEERIFRYIEHNQVWY